MQEKTAKQIRNILSFLLIIVICAVCKITGTVSLQIVLSLFIFMFMWPVASSLDKVKCPKWLTMIICILIIVIVLFACVFFIGQTLNTILSTLPSYTEKIVGIEKTLKVFLGRWLDIPEEASLLSWLNIDWIGYVTKFAMTASASTLTTALDLIITLLLSVFLLFERDSIVEKVKVISHKEDSYRVNVVLDRISKQVSKYIVIKLIVSVITGFLFYVVARLVNLDFAVLWGVLAVVLNFIPNIGSIIITVMVSLMALVQFFPHWSTIIVVAVSTTTIQMVIGNILEPKITGSQLNLSPFFILVALSIFGYIWGIIGTFIAVPILSVVEIILANVEGSKGFAAILSDSFSIKERRKERERLAKSQQKDLFQDVLMPEEENK